MNRQGAINESYIGGFFDGEGSGLIVVVKEKHYNRLRFRPFIKIAQKHREVLDAIRDYLGLGYVCKDGKVYRFFIDNVGGVTKFCKRIMPHTFIKREVLKLLLQYSKIVKKRTKYAPLGNDLLREILEVREKIHQLNKITNQTAAVLKYKTADILANNFEVWAR